MTRGGMDRGAVHVLLLNANGTVKSSVKIASGSQRRPAARQTASILAVRWRRWATWTATA